MAFHMDTVCPADVDDGIQKSIIYQHQNRFALQPKPKSADTNLDPVKKKHREQSHREENHRKEKYCETKHCETKHCEEDCRKGKGPNKENSIRTTVSQTPQIPRPRDSPVSVREEIEVWEPSTTFGEPSCTVEGEEENTFNEDPDVTMKDREGSPTSRAF